MGGVALISAHKEPQSEDLAVLCCVLQVWWWWSCYVGAQHLSWPGPTLMFPNFQSLSIPAWNFTGGLPSGRGEGGEGGGYSAVLAGLRQEERMVSWMLRDEEI